MYATVIGKDYGKPVQGTDPFKFSERNKSPYIFMLWFSSFIFSFLLLQDGSLFFVAIWKICLLGKYLHLISK